MSEKIRDIKRRLFRARAEAFMAKRRLRLCDMTDAQRMVIEGYGWEDIRHATNLPVERCREMVFGRGRS